MSFLLMSCSDPQTPVAPPSNTEGSLPAEYLPIQVDQLPEQARQRIHVEVIAERLMPNVFTAPANVALNLEQVAKVSSRISGQIDTIFVTLGTQVTKNQPLAAVESMRLDELVQEYLVAKAKVDVATSNFKRTNELQAEQIISQRRFLEDQGHQREAQAVYQHVKEKLLNMGLSKNDLHQLEHGSHFEGHKYILRAPLSGTVVDQKVVLGQGIGEGEELFEIVDTSRVWVFAHLPIEQARRFKNGDQGQVVPQGGEPIQAVLAYVAPVADEATRTIRVRFDVDNAQGQLKPNEFVQVRLSDQTKPVLSMPRSAITLVNGVRGVFIQTPTGFEFVPVEVGPETGGLVEVIHGVSAGAAVVTQGVFDLKNAMMKSSLEEG
jgi:RND family efflux transporter MFP subunit